MKRFFLSMLTAVMAISMVSCEYDDSELTGRVNDLEGRVQTLEQLCSQMNTNITAMQAIVNALQTQDAITAVTPITEDGKVIGYTITFSKGDPITIYHGQDGKDGSDGKDGADGEDGYTPVIGVDQAEDGEYYWTLDGEWLTDSEGNKIATSGKDGADGEDGTAGNSGMPQLKIQGGYWYVSYDGGENWERLGRATGYDGSDGKNGQDGDAFFSSVKYAEDDTKDYVEFVLSDGKTFQVPKYKEFSVSITEPDNSYIIVNGDDLTITYTTNCENPTILVISDLTTTIDKNAKKITVKAPSSTEGLDSTETITLLVSNGSTTVMASVDIDVAEASASSVSDVNNLVEDGVTIIALAAGEYNFDDATKGKTLTLIGNSDVVIKVYNEGESGCDYGFDGSTVIFKGVTFDTSVNDGNYKGYARMTATYNNCTFNGSYCTSSGMHTFNNCTFDFKNGYLWTWGANIVTFDGCTFNGNSKNILAHGSASATINIKDCKFNASEKGYANGGKDWTACVEIDPAGSNTYTINFTGKNSKTNNYAGWTRIKDGSTGHTITGVN